MTETGRKSVIERLRIVTDRARALPQVGPVEAAIGVPVSEADLLIAVVEAAKDAQDWMLMPSDVYPNQQERLSEVRTNLRESLKALHSQASDEGKADG